jgi:acyl carrier protein
MSEIKHRIRDFIVENFLMGETGVEIDDDTSFLEADLLDSTGVLELISFISAEWRIVVAPEEMLPENLNSLDALEAYITAKTKEA